MMTTLRITATAVLLALLAGCGNSPGPIGPRAYEHAQALYSVANRQAGDRIKVLAEKIEADLASGALSEHEAQWLGSALEEARSGEWKSAMSAARAMLEDQVSS